MFRGKDDVYDPLSYRDLGGSSFYRTHKPRLRITNERSIITALYNRIAIDVSEVIIQHVRLDENGRYKETIDDELNYLLNTEANIDQTAKAFIQDLVMSMFDEGAVAVLPIETSVNPDHTDSYSIYSARVARIVEWFPMHVKLNVYNDKTGMREDILRPKRTVAIIENPLYPLMNEPNSTLKRLIHKLNLLDDIDEQISSGKIDLIIQLPYVVKSKQKEAEAKRRRDELEMQLSGSKYGVAYTDGTEKITQLNRPVENNMLTQVEYLTKQLHAQLGLTESVFDGTADEAAMLNYDNRTITPIISAIVDEFRRKFLTRTARTQGQTIMAFRNAFKLVPVSSLADIADKFTRNEILSSNEVRSIIGYKPSDDPRADELRNKNLNAQNDQLPADIPGEGGSSIQNESEKEV